MVLSCLSSAIHSKFISVFGHYLHVNNRQHVFHKPLSLLLPQKTSLKSLSGIHFKTVLKALDFKISFDSVSRQTFYHSWNCAFSRILTFVRPWVRDNQILFRHIRNSHRRCSVRKGVLRNLAKFTGKHLCQSLFFNKYKNVLKRGLWQGCFRVNFAILLRTSILQNTFGQLGLAYENTCFLLEFRSLRLLF